MDAERWQRVEELYHAALERPADERAAFLEQACPDGDLRRNVESLVESEPTGNSVLDQPAWERRLAVGELLGPYEIVEQIGVGGMGEVWKARDTRLDRMVAIKVCAERFSARFEREARAIAALNHPHICTLHDVGPNYLVMEYVEGRPLRGPMQVEKAIVYARQILDALEAAHSKRIVHRDLKPPNVLVTASGVKLLDFGLAKVRLAAPESGETVTTLTNEQAVVGTPQYMAPEQIEAKPVDRRTDIFAFGCLLYELLAGQSAFQGKSASSTMAAVLTSEPAAMSKLRPTIPEELDRIVSACLAKDPEERFQTARDVRRALDWVLEARTAPSHARSLVPWTAALGALATLAIATSWVAWRATRSVDSPLMRLSIDLGPTALPGLNTTAVISPDGRRLVFPARGPDGKQQLAMRLLDQAQETLLPGTGDGRDPFFSPDGQWVGFFANSSLFKVSVQGGAPVILRNAYDVRGASWAEDGYIIAAANAGKFLLRFPVAGGPQQYIRLGQDEVTHRWPQALPGGQAVLFTSSPTNFGMDDANIQVVDLRTSATKVVHRGGYYGRYLPSGHLVYVHQGVLFGVAFDPVKLEIRGTPTVLVDDVAAYAVQGGGQFDFSGAESGTLIYLQGKGAAQSWPVLWMESSGQTQPLLVTPGAYSRPRFSPDGRLLALEVRSKGSDIFVYDLQRDVLTRLTFDGKSALPVWGPDSAHIVFQSGGTSIAWVNGSGAGEPKRLLESQNVLVPRSFSPDGRTLAYHVAYEPDAQGVADDLWTLPLDIGDADHPKPGKPELFLSLPAYVDTQSPAFSPDGRWIAYHSGKFSMNVEVYVRPFRNQAALPGSQWQISVGGGRLPVWSRDGRELFYLSEDRRIMVVDCKVVGNSFVAGKPRRWSDREIFNSGGLGFDLAPDGKRFAVFLMPEAREQKGSVHVTMLLNFFGELRRRVPSGGK